MTEPELSAACRRELVEVVGSAHVRVGADAVTAYEPDFTRRFVGRAPGVVRPGSTDEVAGVVDIARAHCIALVPHGGGTGLVGGAVPADGEVVVDLRRLRGITDVDSLGGQLTAAAGTTIAEVQAAAIAAGWAYGVDWAARTSATVGGSVATDAGGLRFVRHGSTRRQLLGVEAVLGTGAVVRHLPKVEKDNVGVDLAAVLCGSEGTLGLVTAARLRLVPPSGPLATALVGFGSVGAAVTAASALRRSLVELEAVELVLAAGLELVQGAFGLAAPFDRTPVAALIVESGGRPDPPAVLGEAVASLVGVLDVAVAVDGPRRRELWRYREGHTEAIARIGSAHKLDVSLPLAELAGFVDAVPALVARIAPDAEVWCFGHAADGNVHVNVTGLDPTDEHVDEQVLLRVVELGGSISAEHGIGRAKRRYLSLARTPAEITALRSLKVAFDPAGMCNPNVLLPPV
jgi:FAD/FMN-containing dehydrogenase